MPRSSTSYELNEAFFQVQQFLEDYPTKIQRRVLQSMLRAMWKPIVKDVKSKWKGLGSGSLAKSVRVSQRSRRDYLITPNGKSAVIIESRLKAAGNANLIEYGTSGGVISKDGFGSLSNYNGEYYGETVIHPGITANPVIRPALRNNVEAALQAGADKLGDALSREAIKMGGSK